jgi:hypothetical protein
MGFQRVDAAHVTPETIFVMEKCLKKLLLRKPQHSCVTEELGLRGSGMLILLIPPAQAGACVSKLHLCWLPDAQ